MSNSNFLNLVKRHFDFLLATHGFSVTSEIFTGLALSEWMIDLCSERLCIRVSLDKAHVFIDVGLPAKDVEWFDLMSIMMYITDNYEWKYLWPAGRVDEEYYDKQLVYLSRIIQDYLEQIQGEIATLATNEARKKQFEKLMSVHSKY